jgi:hypothetical protein
MSLPGATCMETPKWLKDQLCDMAPVDRIPVCLDLLQSDLTLDERAAVWHFLAFDYRETDRPDDALRICETALAESISPDMRGVLLEHAAMALYNLNRLDEVPLTCGRMKGLPLRRTVVGHVIALRGCVLSSRLQPSAFVAFGRAIAVLRAAEHEAGEVWVRRMASSLAVKLGRPSDARHWVESVTMPEAIPAVQILIARSLFLEERYAETVDVAQGVLDGRYGLSEPHDRGWAYYLQGEDAWRQGDIGVASANIAAAKREMSLSRRVEIDLQSAVNCLQSKLRRGEAA